MRKTYSKTARALIRLARVSAAAAVAAGTAAVINAIEGGALEDTPLTLFVVAITAGLTALDKYVRDTVAERNGEA